MRYRSHYLLYLIIAITDAWLLAHPNIVGQFGVWFYKYSYIRNFPRALLTVLLVAASAVVISELVKRYLSIRIAALILTLLLVVGVMIFLKVFFQFTSGTYQYTGKPFIWGAHILPVFLTLIFAQSLYELFRTGKLK
ncbi:MAG: hypothetical protein QM669_07820 [Siphonobacter sp.]